MKQFKLFLVFAMVLTLSGVTFLPQSVLAWTPTLEKAAFLDFDHNGTIDRIKVSFDLAVTTCKFEAGDWVIGSGSIGLTGPTGRLNGAGHDDDCDGTTNYFYLLVSGNTNVTGYTPPYASADIYYRNQGVLNDVQVSGVPVPDRPLINIDDNASPVIVSTVPTPGATGVAVTTSFIRVTFSEPMNTAATSMSISAGSWSPPVWSSSNRTLERSRLLTLPYDTNITVTTSGEDAVGYLLSSGNSPAITNPWSFRTVADPALTVSSSQSAISASPTSVVADGSSISVVTVTVNNASGSPLSGKSVSLTSSRGAADTIASMTGATGSDGKAYFQVRSNTAGSSIFIAMVDSMVITQTAAVIFTSAVPTPGPVSATQSTVTASPVSVLANGTDFSVVTVTVRDSVGNPLGGKLVSLYSSRGAADTIVVGAAGGLTDGSGKAYFDVKSNTAGTSAVTAVSDSVTITQTATVTFTAVASSPSGLIYGDLFKESGSTAVYYYADNGKRYVFPTQAIYFSWYSNFSAIKTVSHSTVTSIPLGGNVLAKPGTYLVQFVSMDTPFRVLDPKVYVLTATGQLRWITSASVAVSLYGSVWESKIIAVPEVYKTNYGNAVPGADVNSVSDYNKASIEAAVPTINDLY